MAKINNPFIVLLAGDEHEAGSLTAYATAQSGVTYSAVTDLTSYTDTQIEEISKAISNCSDITSSTQTIYLSDATSISIGAVRSYTLSTQEAMTDRILGFNHDALTSSTAYGEATATGKAGITWQMVNCLDTMYKMNTNGSTTGGWNDSEMRTTTLPTIKLTMPQSLQNIIKFVDKIAYSGSGSIMATSSDDLFFLAEIEIFGSAPSASWGANEGVQYLYWSTHNTDSDRIKHYDPVYYYTTQWWERSIVYSGFGAISSLGTANNDYPGNLSGVSFAYCT